MTLGSAAAAGVRLIVWCWDCRHQVEPDPAELARQYGDTANISIGDRGRCARNAAAGRSTSCNVPENNSRGRVESTSDEGRGLIGERISLGIRVTDTELTTR
jgi:hypothetical protein